MIGQTDIQVALLLRGSDTKGRIMKNIIRTLNIIAFAYTCIRIPFWGYPGFIESSIIMSMPILMLMSEGGLLGE